MSVLKRQFSILLVILMLAIPFTGTAYALESKTTSYLSIEEVLINDSDTELDVIENEDSTFSVKIDNGSLLDSGGLSSVINQTNTAYHFDSTLYSQLTTRQKLFFDIMDGTSIDEILSSPSYDNDPYEKRVSKTASGVVGTTFAGYVQNNTMYVEATEQQLLNGIYLDMIAANWAFYYDAPAAIWSSGASYVLTFEYLGNKQFQITAADYVYALEFKGQEKQMYDEMNTAVDQIIAAVVDANADRYTKLLAVYTYLIKNNTYSTDSSNPTIIHLPYSALIFNDAYDPVCNGYSSAFKMICDKLNIPCVMATSWWTEGGQSVGHAWNNVKMDDGYWYNLDATNDDADNPRIFLLGSNKMTAYYYQENATYTTDVGTISFTFPAKSASDYEYIGGPKFPDVQSGAWYYDVVLDAAKNGLFKGDTDGYFNPSKNITRAEFAAALVNLFNANTSGYTSSSFSDINSDAWYLGAVEWAKAQSYMAGDADGGFRPTANITRQEMCIVFANIDKQRSENPTSLFPDDASIADYAYGAVYYCNEIGLVVGDDTGNFNPRGNTTRAEAATVFMKYLNMTQE